MAAPPAFAQNRLPALGDTASEDFGIGQERKIGDQIMREIRRDPDYSDDAILLEYLQGVFVPLVGAARQRGEIGPDLDQRFAFEPFLVRDRSVNAFALPGGYIGVHMGLIAMTSTRDELASVLAHEMSHVTQRHIARSIANSKRTSMIGIAATILGILAASRSNNADMANAAIAGGQAASIQGQLNFSRDMEREADRIGFGVMTSAGFAPGGMASMFEKLAQSSRLMDSGGFPYLRSHPLTTERIGEARARLGTTTPAAPVSVLEHTVAQSRARVLMDTRVDALRRWQSRDADNTPTTVSDKLAAACDSALASTLLRDWARADASLQKAQTLVQGSPRSDARAERAVALLATQSMLDRGDPARAEAALKPYATEPSRPVVLLGARIALARSSNEDGWKRAAEELQTWVSSHANDAEAWSLLGQLWGQLGQRLRAMRAEAEARVAVGDLAGAIDRLRAGQRLARGGGAVDFIEASVIDARLRDIETQRRALAADERSAGGPR
ncbi:M48 family metalloprotease [Piscinibacter sp. XHJ-5]|uniref:M48 family metalloprotease n=1 Tax=Piscinibacter sp. XHJ-5 TaxID=3037797 RepID=UPI002453432A|nr:M48 family metalloprotease [Piscinibacter sp. XHJ-5]